MQTEKTPTISRRSVARGISWSVPAVVVATAPAFADSGPCPSLGGTWTTGTATNIANVDQNIDSTTGAITFISDAGVGAGGSISFYKTMNVVAGRVYSFTFDLQTRYGYAGNFEKYNTSVDITIEQGSTSTTLYGGSTQNGYRANVVTPPSSLGNFGASGTIDAHASAKATFKPTTSGTVTFRYSFTLAAPANPSNNDDWKITPTLVCSAA